MADVLHYWEKTVEWMFVRHHLEAVGAAAPLESDKEAAGDAMLSFGGTDKWFLIEFKKDDDTVKKERDKFPALGKIIKPIEGWPNRRIDSIAAYNYIIDNYSPSPRNTPHLIVHGKLKETPFSIYLKKVLIQVIPKVIASGAKKAKHGFEGFTNLSMGAGKSLENKYGCYLTLVARPYWGKDWASKDIPVGTHPCVTSARPSDMKVIVKYQQNQEIFNDYLSYLLLAKGKNPDDSDFDYALVVAVAANGRFQVLTLSEYCHHFKPELELKTEKLRKNLNLDVVITALPANKKKLKN